MKIPFLKLASFTLITLITACNSSGSGSETKTLSRELSTNITSAANGGGLEAFTMPADGDFANIPQDPNNPITAEKVALGQMLYHETAVSTNGNNPGRTGTWSCASCHHVAAGFKAGISQGIAEGGEGFGIDGESRVMVTGFDPDSMDLTLVPDVQPVTSPAVLNIAYQDVMLWNGAFGKTASSINIGVTDVDNAGPADIMANTFGLSGIETQVLAGTKVHRLGFDSGSVLQTNTSYQSLYTAAYPSTGDEGTIPSNGTTVSLPALGAAKAIAAYERTIMANQSPFQRWLKGDEDAMSAEQLRGALLFFGKAGCVDCHRGPALSSEVGATEDQVFFAIGFADYDSNDPSIHGSVDEATSKGRGGFTGEDADNFKFKIPQLYNLVDANVFGHGASFTSVKQVIEYKNAAVPQKALTASAVDSRFTPLGLDSAEIDDLTTFIESALYDSSLTRYVPTAIPTGNCFPMADSVSITDLGC
ncbi:MAG: cytochrome-c peroxidase [Cellvibrionaceae bacterium]